MTARVPENVYRGELIAYPGPWAFDIGRAHIILVSDRELEALSDPDAVLDLSLTFDKHEASLRQICEQAQAAGQRTLILAFDHFFQQYRPGQDEPRRLTPDMDAYIERIAAISKFAQGYGLGLELSLLSPLEIGPAYAAKTRESGLWMHYRKGLRDPQTGAFSVQLWRQRQWVNNKGPVRIEDAGVRAFAFREQPVRGTPYRVVDPAAIIEITEGLSVEEWPNVTAGGGVRIVVRGTGGPTEGDLDRVLVVQQYRVPEMDYLSPNALPYLNDLVDRYADAGVKLNGLYSDEMHIQQDWDYFGHHDNGEFAMRYVSPGLAARYAEEHGEEYRDFAKWLVYFAYGQEDSARDLSAKQGVMHVFGASPQEIRRTALFRSRYYRLLQDGVVDLFVAAKRHAEERMGHRLESRAHATWAESPTIDRWDTPGENEHPHKYEYTSNFVWSNTVHQAAAACHDYFRWGDFLTGGGNDHPEGGWLDRDYYALALACSTGVLNEVPLSYCAHWGMPGAIGHRRQMLAVAYGTTGGPWAPVQGLQHRDCEVLMLYPLDLVAVEERFGSWMTQYGYANLITQAKLLERGRVVDGALEVAGRRYTTLATQFEPFPSERLLALMREFVEGGGRLVWSGPPPVLTAEGGDALGPWMDVFGVDYVPSRTEGLIAPGRMVTFEGALAGVQPQTILTDLLVDHIYLVAPQEGTETVARCREGVIGTLRRLPDGGSATFLGYRPRDDQAQSLGYDVRNWFELLSALGAYPPTGRFEGANDNTEALSRTGEYLACRFPNGAITITRHLRDLVEDWPGGFARDREADAKYMEAHPLPPDALDLQDYRVDGHSVTFQGNQALAFRVDGEGALTAFCGCGARSITIDGRETVYADQPMGLVSWAPVAEERRVPKGALMQALVHGGGAVRIPAGDLPAAVEVIAEGATPGSRGQAIASRREGGTLVIDQPEAAQGRWMYVVER
jgi:hypothetical protein